VKRIVTLLSLLVLTISANAQFMGWYGTGANDSVAFSWTLPDSTVGLAPINADTVVIWRYRQVTGGGAVFVDSVVKFGTDLSGWARGPGHYTLKVRAYDGTNQGNYFADVHGWDFINSKRIYGPFISISWACGGEYNAVRLVSAETVGVNWGNVANQGAAVTLSGTTVGTVTTLTGTANANVTTWLGATPNVLVSGRVDASVGAMAANVFTATALDNSAVVEYWQERFNTTTYTDSMALAKLRNTFWETDSINTDVDVATSTRMATYTQPTGFLAATFPSGIIASTTNITGGIITTVTNLTNNNDKTGYGLSATTIRNLLDSMEQENFMYRPPNMVSNPDFEGEGVKTDVIPRNWVAYAGDNFGTRNDAWTGKYCGYLKASFSGDSAMIRTQVFEVPANSWIHYGTAFKPTTGDAINRLYLINSSFTIVDSAILNQGSSWDMATGVYNNTTLDGFALMFKFKSGTTPAVCSLMIDNVYAYTSLDSLKQTIASAGSNWSDAQRDSVLNRTRTMQLALVAKKGVASGTPTTTKFVSTDLTEGDDYWNDNYLIFFTGNAKGQPAYVKDFFDVGDSIQNEPGFTVAPASGDSFVIFTGGALGPTLAQLVDSIWEEAKSGHTTAGTYGKYLDTNITHPVTLTPGERQAVADTTEARWNKEVNVVSTDTIKADVLDKTGYRLSGMGIDDIFNQPLGERPKGSSGEAIRMAGYGVSWTMGNNLVNNSSFEIDSIITTAPTGWNLRQGGRNQFTIDASNGVLGGRYAARFANVSAGQTDTLYSSVLYLSAGYYIAGCGYAQSQGSGSAKMLVKGSFANEYLNFSLINNVSATPYIQSRKFRVTTDDTVRIYFLVVGSATPTMSSAFDNVFLSPYAATKADTTMFVDTTNQILEIITTSLSDADVIKIADTLTLNTRRGVMQRYQNDASDSSYAKGVTTTLSDADIVKIADTLTLNTRRGVMQRYQNDPSDSAYMKNPASGTSVDSAQHQRIIDRAFEGRGLYKLTLIARDSTGAVNVAGITIQLKKQGAVPAHWARMPSSTNGEVVLNTDSGTYDIFAYGAGYVKTSPDTIKMATANRTDTVYLSAFTPSAPTLANGVVLYGFILDPDATIPTGAKVTISFSSELSSLGSAFNAQNLYEKNASDTTQAIWIRNQDWSKSVPITKLANCGVWQVEVRQSPSLFMINSSGQRVYVNPTYQITIPGIPSPCITLAPAQTSKEVTCQ